MKAPSYFDTRDVGWTVVNKSQGTHNAATVLKGRIMTTNLGDLKNEEKKYDEGVADTGDQYSFRNIKLIVEDVSGKSCLTNFYGTDMVRDKRCSMIRKWQSLIQVVADVRTTDGYLVRISAFGFTKRADGQVKQTSYCKASQAKEIRRKMVEVVQEQCSSVNLKDLVGKLIPGHIGDEMKKVTVGIYPLNNVYVKKIKMLKRPKFDISRLQELHEGGPEVAPDEDANDNERLDDDQEYDYDNTNANATGDWAEDA